MGRRAGSKCPLGPRFYGLTPESRAEILEQHYFLIRHLGISYAEIRDMPLLYRKWFIDRFIREVEERNSSMKRAQVETQSANERVDTLERRLGKQTRSF